LSRIRAWSSFAAAARPVFTKANNCSCSSVLSRTMDLTSSALLSGSPPQGEPIAEHLSSELC
jgi:hypothetical protein